jgi:cell division septation protein DedD
MTQNDMPAPAVVGEETAVVEYVPPSPPRTEPKPAKPAPRSAAAPDPFAVGVRVLKMAPAWLLFTAFCCSALVLLLGWVRAGSDAGAATLPAKHNDARAAKRAPAAGETAAKSEGSPSATDSSATTSGPKSTAANDAPAQTVAQAAAPAAAPPKADEKARAETPAPAAEGEGNFTAQVGSFNSQSEANGRVSSLRAAGFDARVAAAELPGRGTWYRVQVGRFADKVDAAKAVAALRAKGAASGALVVPVQK